MEQLPIKMEHAQVDVVNIDDFTMSPACHWLPHGVTAHMELNSSSTVA
jgi:hypothetical protein